MDFRGGLGRGTAWSQAGKNWGTEMDDPQIASLFFGTLIGFLGSASLLPAFVLSMNFLHLMIILTNILLLARLIVFVIKPVVRIITKDHPSLLNQMRIIFFLIMSSDSLFFDGLVITLMLFGILVLFFVSGVGAINVGLGFLSVAPVLTVVRIIWLSISKKS